MKKETRFLLNERAVAMAIEPEQQRDRSTLLEMIEFKLASENYGIESSFVREVFSLTDFTQLPGVPSFVLGIVNVHGQILPVLNLKVFFNLQETGLGEFNKVIIVCNDQIEFGIVVDEIKGTKMIYAEELLPVPPGVKGIAEKYLKGLTKDRLIIISADILLSDKKIIVYEEVNQ